MNDGTERVKGVKKMTDNYYRVYQKKFTVGKGLLMQKAFNAFNKIL